MASKNMIHVCVSNFHGVCYLCEFLIFTGTGMANLPTVTVAPFGLTDDQKAIGWKIANVERKRLRQIERAEKAAMAADDAEKAAEKAAAKVAQAAEAKRATAQREANRAAAGAARRAAKVAKVAKVVAPVDASAPVWTVRVRWLRGADRISRPEVRTVRIDAPNPREIAESKAARKIRAEILRREGFAKDGTMRGMGWDRAERLSATLRGKLARPHHAGTRAS